MNHVVFRNYWLTLYHGRAVDYAAPERPDLLLTNPYGPIADRLLNVPMLVHQWKHRLTQLAGWIRHEEADLQLVSLWNRGREAVWAVGLPVLPVDLSDLVPTEEGWWPEALPRRLLAVYGHVGETVWDGFCGRCTGALAAREVGMNFIGIDERMEALDVARAYLGVEGPVFGQNPDYVP